MAALLLVNSLAQESGSVTGQVLDPTGVAIVNAKLTVTSVAMGATFSTLSDQTGFYRVPQLLPGAYTITCAAQGFGASTGRRHCASERQAAG